MQLMFILTSFVRWWQRLILGGVPSRVLVHPYKVHTLSPCAVNSLSSSDCLRDVTTERKIWRKMVNIFLQIFLSVVTSLSSASFIPVTSCISSIRLFLGHPVLLLPSHHSFFSGGPAVWITAEWCTPTTSSFDAYYSLPSLYSSFYLYLSVVLLAVSVDVKL